MLYLCYPLLFYVDADYPSSLSFSNQDCALFSVFFRYVVLYTLPTDNQNTTLVNQFRLSPSLSCLSLLFSHIQPAQLPTILQNGFLFLSHFPPPLILSLQLIASLSTLSSLSASATKWLQSHFPLYSSEAAIPVDLRAAYLSLLRSLNSFCKQNQSSLIPFSVRSVAMDLLSRACIPSEMMADLAWVVQQVQSLSQSSSLQPASQLSLQPASPTSQHTQADTEDVSWLKYTTSLFHLLFSFVRTAPLPLLQDIAAPLLPSLWERIHALRTLQHASANQRAIEAVQTTVQLCISILCTLLRRVPHVFVITREDVARVVDTMLEEEEGTGLADWQYRKQETLQVEYYHCFTALAACAERMDRGELDALLVLSPACIDS